MATKLKNLSVTSVDLVDRGANPDAHIRLFKRGEQPQETDPDMGLFQKFLRWLKKGFEDATGTDGQEENPVDDVEKEAQTFGASLNREQMRHVTSEMFDNCYALSDSFCSILCDDTLDAEKKKALMLQSLDEFAETVKGAVGAWAAGKQMDTPQSEAGIQKSTAQQEALAKLLGQYNLGDDPTQPQSGKIEKEVVDTMKIDKSKMTPEELAQVNGLVNDMVLLGSDVCTEVLPIEEAKKKGAIALFGEKYGDTVRVVDMGDGYSVEFCGGTHLSNTAMAGAFHITSEFSVASGVRRIEATTGRVSLETMNRNQELIFKAAAALKAKPGELREKAEAVMLEMKALRQHVEKLLAKEAAGETERIMFGAHEVGGLKVITATISDADSNRLRQMGDILKDRDPNVVAVLAAVSGEKITFLCVCGKEAVKRGIKAGDIIKQVSAIAGGSGGGKPDSAMGGGKDPLMVDNALAMVDNVVSMKLGL